MLQIAGGDGCKCATDNTARTLHHSKRQALIMTTIFLGSIDVEKGQTPTLKVKKVNFFNCGMLGLETVLMVSPNQVDRIFEI